MNRRSLLLTLLALPATGKSWFGKGQVPQLNGVERVGLLATAGRRVLRFDADWRFHLGDLPNAQEPGVDDGGWEVVQLPHDWGIRLPFIEDAQGAQGDYSQKGIGWYRKSFHVPESFGGRAILDFDGIYQQSQVWLNGVHVGGRAYGVVPFQVDLTEHLQPGQPNVLAVRVDNETGQRARWYSGSGINRHAWLTLAAKTRIAPWGMRVSTTSLSAGYAELNIEIDVISSEALPAPALVKSTIFSADGRVTAVVTVAVAIKEGSRKTATQSVVLRTPDVWSPDHPVLYRLQSEVLVEGQTVDDAGTTFGIRQIEWHHDFGLLLNGTTTKLRGVCLHTDCGMAGSAVPDQVLERRLRILKTLGCNAIRIAHHPAPSELLDLCDRMGFLVIEEAFDKWNLGFAEGVEHPNFAEDWDRDLSAMLDRDRNHPCIVAWSVGNEAGQPGTAEHDEMLERLVAYVKKNEPTRAVTCAFIGSNEGTIEDNVQAILRAGHPLDFLSLNYLERFFHVIRQTEPSALVVASETYPFFRSVFGGVEPFNGWYEASQNQWVAGGFVWTGFDYLGESAGWPSRGWPNGLIDSCGFPKPQSDFFRTVWSEAPTVSISVVDPRATFDPGLDYWRSPPAVAHWNLVEDEVYAVQTLSNTESVELIVDGISYGRKLLTESLNQANIWFVRHQRGQITAVARIGEAIVAEAALRSAGEATAIEASLDRPLLRANGRDVCHLEVSLIDADRTLVPDGDREIHLDIAGPGLLLGMDNGDLRSEETYDSGKRTTRNGRLLAIVQARREEGSVTISASAEGLPTATWTIDVRLEEEALSDYPAAGTAL